MKKTLWVLIVMAVLVGVAIFAAAQDHTQPLNFIKPDYITVFLHW